MKSIATRVILKGYKGPEWERELPWRGEEKAKVFEHLVFELEVACSALRIAVKQWRADPSEVQRRNLWERRRDWWVAHYRMLNWWDKNSQA